MMTKEGSTKIVNLMTPGAGVFVLGHGLTIYVMKITMKITIIHLFCVMGHGSDKLRVL